MFPESYLQARHQFLASVKQTKAQLHSHTQQGVTGLEGEPLVIDAAVLGAAKADRAAIVFTGVHGAEAFCGSAILGAWLASASASALPPDVKLVLVHAANPWGYSHMTRTTENNVDLNRNFRTSWGPIVNSGYTRLRDFYHQPIHDAADYVRAFGNYRAFLQQNGWGLEIEMAQGQTEFPDGLYFAGQAPEWANLALRQIIRDTLSGASKIGFLDIHTGLGQYGEISYLLFAPEGSELREKASAWWTSDRSPSEMFLAGKLPDYQGLLCDAVKQEQPTARVAGAVMEFGVADAFGMFRSDHLDRWLRFEGRTDPDLACLRLDYRDSCTPRDIAWRRQVLRAGPAAIDRLLAGVVAW